MPYFVQSEFGFKEVSKLTRCSWCSKDQLRNLGETPEEKEEFKFGDKVEARLVGKWREAVVIDNDHSGVPYKIITPDNDIRWCLKEDVRRA